MVGKAVKGAASPDRTRKAVVGLKSLGPAKMVRDCALCVSCVGKTPLASSIVLPLDWLHLLVIVDVLASL